MEKEKFVDNLLTFVPFIYKRLMKSFPTFSISKQQFGLLAHISNEDEKPMNYYSEKMMVPKPNLTLMADKLIEEGLIERAFDPDDRRIIILKITSEGIKYLHECKETVKQEMVKKLDTFDENDIKRLNILIEEMKAIFDKVEL